MTRLRRSKTNGKGYHRVRVGKGFSYRDPDGRTITDKAIKSELDSLAIPPAWNDVWISPYPNGHILATGIDGAGRRQYMYHPSWREKKDRIKYDRAMRLAEALPAARRQVTMDLRREGYPRERILAAGFRMLDTANLRVGSERYAQEHGSHGLTTLLCAHATTSGDVVHLAFPGKSGQDWDSEVTDSDLATLVRVLKRRGPNARLLAWKDTSGEWHPVSAEEINDYVRERTGGGFTAKDFRTLHGTAAAAVSLARSGPQKKVGARKHALAEAMRDASVALGNTPSIAKKSYVDPRLVDRYEHGETIDPARLASVESELRALLYD